MLSFVCDYLAGAHPEILRRLTETNFELLPGYGVDKYCQSAREKIKAACECPEAEVFFLVGGTQTNAVVISTMLEGFEGVVTATTGHINMHEAGAVENTGHKVLGIGQKHGKINASELKDYIETFYRDASYEHMVFPGMVYISHPTEYGGIYSKAELADIYAVCREFDIPLFIDGARLGYGLMSNDSDLTLPEIARLCDVFYIGGTKVGALCGEAVVFTKQNTPKRFMTSVKRQGAMLAKGRLLGIQFDTLFTNNLYFEISKSAIDKAEKMKAVFSKKGYRFFYESPTNQQFIILENSVMKELAKKVGFDFWEEYDENHTVVRFATGWHTTDGEIEQLAEIL